MSSSPDPLHDTPRYQFTKAFQSSRPRHSFPRQLSSPTKQSVSPTKQTFELDIGNRRLTQKIRVTVEAGSDVENDETHDIGIQFEDPSPTKGPVKGVRARTTTTTVAVKGLSDSEDAQPTTPKRGRGRPRKSGTPVPAKLGQRASTPVRKNAGRRRSVGTLVDGDDENDEDFNMGKNVEITRRGRPRSKSIKGKPRKSIPEANESGVESALQSSISGENLSEAGNRGVAVEQDADPTNTHEVESMNEHQQMAGNLGEHDQALSDDGLPSTYSLMRSALAPGYDVDDVVFARFKPGNETPRLPGWSSPRFVETHHERDQQSFTLPKTYPEAEGPLTSLHSEERLKDFSHSSSQPRSSNFQTHADISAHALNETQEHGLEEVQEFDTLLESEGFSMISVDSIPSLREHLSSPANQLTTDDSQLSSTHENSLMPSASVISRMVPTSSTSSNAPKIFASKPENLHLRRHPASHISVSDSFSSAAADISTAASPQKIIHVSKISQRLLADDNSFSSIAPEVLAAASPVKLPQETPSSQQRPSNHNHSRYDDSFSGIPSAILDAATPAPVRQMLRKAQALEPIRLSVPVSKSTSTRLLTPEETPSPPSDSSAHSVACKQREHQSNSYEGRKAPSTNAESSPVNGNIKSSPPAPVARRYTYTAHLRQQRQLQGDMNQTPSIIFSSPSLPPPIQLNRGNAKSFIQQDDEPRPMLSPIVQAGRVLQNVLVSVTSPRSRAHSLGSPFKSPLVDRHHFSPEGRVNSADKQEQGTGFIGLGLENFAEMSSRKEPGKMLTDQDDPFGASTRLHQSRLSPQGNINSLGCYQQRQLSGSPFSGSLTFNDSTRSEDAMSWQADQEAEIPALVSSCNNSLNARENGRQPVREGRSLVAGNAKIWEEQWAAERAAVVKRIASEDQSNVIFIESDGDDENNDKDTQDNEDDADFGLLLETLNSSSPVSQQAPALHREALDKPRRSKLPSPWRKNSKRLVYNDELYNLTATSEDLFGPKEKPTTTQLSADPITVRRTMPAINNSYDTQADLSGWHIPQKSNFQPKTRNSSLNADLSALFASSPMKPLPAPSRLSKKVTDYGETKASLPNPSTIGSHAKNLADENIEFAPIPQKADFKPRPRRSSFASAKSSPINPSSFGIFGGPSITNFIRKPIPVPSISTTIRKVLAPSSPSKTNSLPFPSQLISPTQPEPSLSVPPSSPGYDTSCMSIDDKENAEIHQRTLKWTESLQNSSSANSVLQPAHTISPTKSCLRSPLKTPLYTTRHLTPTHPTTLPSSSKSVAFVSSSPVPSSPTTVPLSTTLWSRAHWVLLDGIVQTWKPENQSPAAQLPRRRNSTRVISKLLGRMVRAEGGEMRLEQWHLDAVDEFRGRVNGGAICGGKGTAAGDGEGWEEKVIALRVFALLEGERRRKEGLID